MHLQTFEYIARNGLLGWVAKRPWSDPRLAPGRQPYPCRSGP